MYERIKEITKRITANGQHCRRLSVCLFSVYSMYSFSKMQRINNLPSCRGDPGSFIRKIQHIALCQNSTDPSPQSTGDQASITGDNDKQHYDREFNFVLIGATGSGKSNAGNFLLSEQAFDDSLSTKSETNKCKLKDISKTIDKKTYKINIVDTPSAVDNGLQDQELQVELQKLLKNKAVDAYVFCIPATAMTNYFINDIKHYEKHFGHEMSRSVIAVFTRYDQFEPAFDNEPDKKEKLFKIELSKAIKHHSTLGKIVELDRKHIYISKMTKEVENYELNRVVGITLKKENKRAVAALNLEGK